MTHSYNAKHHSSIRLCFVKDRQAGGWRGWPQQPYTVNLRGYITNSKVANSESAFELYKGSPMQFGHIQLVPKESLTNETCAVDIGFVD